VGAFLLIGVASDHAGVVIGTGFLNGVRQAAHGFAAFFNDL
jgi:hypothetical protein